MRRAPGKLERFLLLLLLGFVLCVSAAGFAYYTHQKKALEEAAAVQLSAIADLKVSQLVRWREERLADGNLILKNAMVSDVAKRFISNPSDIGARDQILALMQAWKKYNRYSRAVLLDANQAARLASSPEETWIGPVAFGSAVLASATNRVVLSDLHLSSVSGLVNMDLLVPLRDSSKNALIGLLMFEIDPHEFLFPQIQRWPTPSLTAETLLVRREGEDVVYMNELRHKTNTALRLRLPLAKSPELPAAKAVLGFQGFCHGLDYRNVNVISVVQPVPGSTWFVVAKQDLSEINRPLRQGAAVTIIISAMLILAASLGVGLLWRIREARYTRQELEEKRQSEAALQHSFSLLRATLESTADGILVVDAAGKVCDFNRQFTHLWRLPESALVDGDDESIRKLVLTQLKDQAGFIAGVKKLYSQPEAESYDLVEFLDGRVYERYSRPQRVEGRPIGRVWSFRDITERRRTELERERLTYELERKNEDLENLIYASSHDLRSPLVNIEGFSKRLEKACRDLASNIEGTGPVPGTREEILKLLHTQIPKSLNYIRSGVAKMNALISGLLHLSRLGQVPLRMETLDMNRLLQGVLATVAYQIQKAEAVVQVDPLPQCQGDALLINQVFSNLVDNALKYRDPSRPLVIRITGHLQEDQILYSVEDSGIGIAPEHQARVWELFHRLDPNGPLAGEGLGLNLVRRILDRHHGRVWVESTPGVGSRFIMSLPKMRGGEPKKARDVNAF